MDLLLNRKNIYTYNAYMYTVAFYKNAIWRHLSQLKDYLFPIPRFKKTL